MAACLLVCHPAPVAVQPNVETLRRSHRGPVIGPGDAGYAAARESFNALIQASPDVIARPTGPEDVRTAIEFARETGLPVSVRGGGHSVAGHSVGDGSVMIDLRLLRDVSVDLDRRVVQVGGGCCWNDVDARTQSFGLAMPGGTYGDTGVAGLTLTGGIGHLIGAFGLTLDNLAAAEVVTADGRVIHAGPDVEPDLFWALRGGGGNFGVVTSFTFRVHEVSVMTGGLLIHRLDDAEATLGVFRDMREELPDALTLMPALTSSEGLIDEKRVLLTTVAFLGPAAAAAEAIAPLRARKPLLDTVGPMHYSQIQGLYAYMPFGLRNYWTGRFLPELSDDLIGFLVEQFATGHPDSSNTVLFEPLHGVASRVSPDETAFGFRDARFNVSGLAVWEDPSLDPAELSWAHEVRERLAPLSRGGYLNYVSDSSTDPAEDAFLPDAFARLRAIKASVGPGQPVPVQPQHHPAA